jgi:GntR family transcriptional repressor for pyruvate dehydrogenase complex
LERISLIDSIVKNVKEKIVNGEYKPGDMLPSQDELAKILGVSRASLREAINRLELMGLTESKHGLGTFVKTPSSYDYMSQLSSFLVLDQRSAFELLQARRYIEGSVAALAAKCATDSDIEKMEEILSAMENARDHADVEQYIERDVKFHFLIAESCKNRVLLQIVDILRDLLRQLIARVFAHSSDQLEKIYHETNKFHRNIFNAIKNRDAEAAKIHMESHIEDVRNRIQRMQVA